MASPSEIWSSVAGAHGLGWRIATALLHLERRWPLLSADFRRGVNGSRAIVDAFLAEEREFQLLDEVEDVALRFLADREALSDDELLAFLKIVDALIAPFVNSRLLEGMIEGEYELDDDVKIALWIAPRGIAWLIGDEPREPKVHQSTDYAKLVTHHLWWIHHALGVAARRPIEISEKLHGEVARKFADLWGDEEMAIIRIGLFSLRGDFEPDFTITRVEEVDNSQLYLFRAGDMRNDDGYVSRIEETVRLASDPERSIQILVFPEFMMTGPGVAALRRTLQEEYRQHPRRKPPLLVFAGSLHQERSEGTSFGNCCRVFDCSGQLVWEQWKRIPYGGREKEELLADLFSNLPAGTKGRLRVHEDIETDETYVIGRTPLGAFGVAICSDMMLGWNDTPRTVWSEVPVDWVVIPSYTESTKRFLDVSHELVNGPKMVLFANAFPAVRFTTADDVTAPWDLTPNKLGTDQARPVAAFINCAWAPPHALWFAANVNIQSIRGCTPGFVGDQLDGLVIDLGKFLDF